MQHKKLFLLVFILVSLVQIYVPARMVYDSEAVLDEGAAYKFKAAPVDPNDPFRGKYITLAYDIEGYQVDNSDNWHRGEEIFVHLTTDNEGFAKILEIRKTPPAIDVDYVKATVAYSYLQYPEEDSIHHIEIDYPFSRYYMEESKTYDAELAYNRSSRDTSQTTWALIHIKDGEPIIKDVMIDDIPIREIVKQANENL